MCTFIFLFDMKKKLAYLIVLLYIFLSRCVFLMVWKDKLVKTCLFIVTSRILSIDTFLSLSLTHLFAEPSFIKYISMSLLIHFNQFDCSYMSFCQWMNSLSRELIYFEWTQPFRAIGMDVNMSMSSLLSSTITCMIDCHRTVRKRERERISLSPVFID